MSCVLLKQQPPPQSVPACIMTEPPPRAFPVSWEPLLAPVLFLSAGLFVDGVMPTSHDLESSSQSLIDFGPSTLFSPGGSGALAWCLCGPRGLSLAEGGGLHLLCPVLLHSASLWKGQEDADPEQPHPGPCWGYSSISAHLPTQGLKVPRGCIRMVHLVGVVLSSSGQSSFFG